MVLTSCRNDTVVKKELKTFDSLVIIGNLYGNVKGMKIAGHRTNVIIGDTTLCIIHNRTKIGEMYQMITKNCKCTPFLKLLFIHISINLKFVIRTLLFDVEIIDFSRLSYLNSVYSIRYFLKSFLLNRDVYKE